MTGERREGLSLDTLTISVGYDPATASGAAKPPPPEHARSG